MLLGLLSYIDAKDANFHTSSNPGIETLLSHRCAIVMNDNQWMKVDVLGGPAATTSTTADDLHVSFSPGTGTKFLAYFCLSITRFLNFCRNSAKTVVS